MPKAKTKAERLRSKPMPAGPGYDGHVLANAQVQLSTLRFEKRTIRCRPGSFEWSYGTRKQHGTLYHAGVHFSGLWERAHITVASPNLTPSVATQWRGLPDSRAEALSEIKRLGQHIGTYAMSRLIDYCILGNTTTEIGSKYGLSSKAMHHVMHCDLSDVASHFNFIGKRFS